MTATDYAGPDRRSGSDSLNLQIALAKLVAKVDGLEESISTKLESREQVHGANDKAFEARIEGSLSRIESRIGRLEEDLESTNKIAADESGSFTDVIGRFKAAEVQLNGVIGQIITQNAKIHELVARVRTVEVAPGQASLSFLKWAGGIVGSLIIVGIVSLVWLSIKK